MNIGIIGSGSVGQTLGAGFAAHGHRTFLGSRSPHRDSLQAWLKTQDGRVQVGTHAEAAAFGDLLVLVTGWEDTEKTLRLVGPGRTAGKVVLDVTNPLTVEDGEAHLTVSGEDSAGERVQRWLPDAHVVKCFATVGAGLMIDPDLPEPPTMFIAGDSVSAKEVATQLLGEVGWTAFDLGGIEAARYLEALAVVWVRSAIRMRSRDFVLGLIKKPE